MYNHVLKLDLGSLQWNLVDNYGDIPGVRMGVYQSQIHSTFDYPTNGLLQGILPVSGKGQSFSYMEAKMSTENISLMW